MEELTVDGGVAVVEELAIMEEVAGRRGDASRPSPAATVRRMEEKGRGLEGDGGEGDKKEEKGEEEIGLRRCPLWTNQRQERTSTRIVCLFKSLSAVGS